MAKRYTVPNWGQALIAREIGLNPDNVAVEHESDQYISFLRYMPRKFFLVSKIDGTVIES